MKAWWLVLLLVPMASAQVPLAAPAHGFVDVWAPPVLRPVPNETTTFHLEVRGEVECWPGMSPPELHLFVARGAGMAVGTETGTVEVYRIEPEGVKLEWRERGSEHVLDANLTFQLISQGLPLHDLEHEVTWRIAQNLAETDCTPAGYTLDTTVSRSIVLMPAPAAQAAAQQAPAVALPILACILIALAHRLR